MLKLLVPAAGLLESSDELGRIVQGIQQRVVSHIEVAEKPARGAPLQHSQRIGVVPEDDVGLSDFYMASGSLTPRTFIWRSVSLSRAIPLCA
jgi:hypothetical protein